MHPKHAFKPEDLLTFIEAEGFTDDWRDLGLSDDDLAALQSMIMMWPKGNPVIAATGGLRKIRFAPQQWSKGKRGAVRVCYAYFEEYGIVLLVVAYAKNEKDALKAAQKKAIREYIQRQKKVFGERTIR